MHARLECCLAKCETVVSLINRRKLKLTFENLYTEDKTTHSFVVYKNDILLENPQLPYPSYIKDETTVFTTVFCLTVALS